MTSEALPAGGWRTADPRSPRGVLVRHWPLLAGLLLLVPLALTSGTLGVGTLTDIGANVWAVCAAVAGWVALGCAAGYLVALALAGRRFIPPAEAAVAAERPRPRRSRD